MMTNIIVFLANLRNEIQNKVGNMENEFYSEH